MSDTATRQLIAALREGFDGPRGSGYFLDSDAGLLRTLGDLSAEEASRERGGNSIAAHAAHILFGLEVFAAFVSGDRAKRDWNESWRVSTVDDESWRKLQAELGRGFETMRDAIETHAAKSEEALGGSLASIAHLAYHLGAIRQKLTFSA